MAKEYYILKGQSKDKEGPYTIEDMEVLAGAGRLAQEHLYSEGSTEKWIAIRNDEAMKRRLFPHVSKLSLVENIKEHVDKDLRERVKREETRDIKVQIEGDMKAREYKERLKKEGFRTLNMLGLMLVLSGFGLIWPERHGFVTALSGIYSGPGIWGLLVYPHQLVGALDILCATFLFLGSGKTLHIVKLRAMLGAVYFGYYYGVMEKDILMAGVVMLGMVCVLYCTKQLSVNAMRAGSVLGVISMGLFVLMVVGAGA